jgi:CHAD domain-containing protein
MKTTTGKARATKTAGQTALEPPQKAQQTALSDLMFPAQAFAAIARGCLAQLTDNAAGALAGDDPEYVHQMRVALRRLRSALRIFKPHLPDDFFQAAGEELRWLAALLGSARDWDVLAADTLPRMFGARPPRAAAELQRHLLDLIVERRDNGRAAVRAALAARRFRALVREWKRALAALEEHPPHGGRLADFVAQVLRRSDKTIHLPAGSLARMSVDKRHRYRIAAKRLRYAVDFFAPLYARERVKPYAGALARLQDSLGVINDNAVALELITTLPVTAGEFALLQQALDESTIAALKQAQAAAKKLGAVKPFWPTRRR